jgi:hypothetical protein
MPSARTKPAEPENGSLLKNTTMSRSKCRSVRLRDLDASRFAEHSKPNECFYEKVIKVKADVAAVHSADLQASPDELKAAILLFYCLLDEQQRRLFAGLESIRLGHGGDTLLGDFLGLDVHTVARGRQQLLDQNVVSGRSRRTGGGRTSAEKNARHNRGSPWPARTRYRGRSHDRLTLVSPHYHHYRGGVGPTRHCRMANTDARLLHDMGYSLRVNQKQISTSSSSNRNLQFQYLPELRYRFRRRHLPIVRVDSKKRELVGNFKNPGCRWESAPRGVYDHDFRTDSIGVAIRYAIYDVMEDRGALVVGISHAPIQARRSSARSARRSS